MDQKQLLKGAYDLHVHSAPDLLPRKMNDLEMGQRIVDAGMAGYAIKSHFFCTSERAALVNIQHPKCHAIGAIVLNRSVGGVSPVAVEIAGRSGAKIVWFPTCDALNERKHVFDGNPDKKLPYWAQILIQMKEDGVAPEPIEILKEDGRLTNEAYDVLDVMAKYNMILATGHISHEECFELVKAASERKVERIIITHVDFPATFYTIEEQKKLASYGAYMEHCYTTWATGKVELSESINQIKAMGADRVILATDLGQANAKYPDEGLLEYAEELIKAGMSEDDISKMIVSNPASLAN
ncbi:MAG: DUF6282 family protein [Defluviitaleaceae bacterium]|nr:DUF6282 family protein [Defluviitaleaceae bacterium]